MKVTAGFLKAKTIKTPKGVRPSSSIVREAIFNILYSLELNIENIKILDLFSGTGIISFEFISRGASNSTLVDNSKLSTKYQLENLKNLKIQDQVKIINKDSLLFVQSLDNLNNYNIIFLDPPYEYKNYYKLVNLLINKKTSNSLIIVESSDTNYLDNELKKRLIKERKWGKTFILIFK